MARLKERPLPAELVDGAPPDELVRFSRARWGGFTDEGLSRWLWERAAWRAAGGEPLPSLAALERYAVGSVVTDRALVEAEEEASRGRRPPPFRQQPVVDRPAGVES